MGTNAHSKAFAPPTIGVDGKEPLVGLSLEEMTDKVLALGLPKFRAKQIYSWIYQHGATSFDEMTNLSKDLREKLEGSYTLQRPEMLVRQISEDETEKYLLRMVDGQEIETVLIPESDRGTLCVSSQVGCTLSCTFCHTGTQGLVRNLSAKEIVLQVMMTRDALEEWPSSQDRKRKLTNIVFMGMGEPLYNYDEIVKAIKLLTDGDGLAFSKRKITVSTSGVVPLIEKLGEDVGTGLAISLHATTNELRNKLVPLNRKYPIEELLQACRDYPASSNARRITFEYVMLKDVNDGVEDAKQLISLLDGIPAKVNLIPFNPWPGSSFECSEWSTINRFGDILMNAGYASPVRRPRGRDILAACGQLKSESQRQRKSKTG